MANKADSDTQPIKGTQITHERLLPPSENTAQMHDQQITQFI